MMPWWSAPCFSDDNPRFGRRTSYPRASGSGGSLWGLLFAAQWNNTALDCLRRGVAVGARVAFDVAADAM
jgi:hypothetical protein